MATGLALLLLPGSAGAQLISPGRLARVHSELEGMRSCMRCHELRKPGISPELCLACHTPLARRLEAGEGFHSTLAERYCAACHKDHLGEAYASLRFDTVAFDHGRAGWTLDGAHADLDCRACHTPERVTNPVVRRVKAAAGALDRTYLGLPTGCLDCHAADDPHDGQFRERPCTDCHDTRAWEKAPGFDHGRTRYPLTGRHAEVACAGCHGMERRPGGEALIRYRPVAHEGCATCHDDPHDGAMEGECSGCHDTGGWRNVRAESVEGRFDHAATGFVLEGRHAEASCSSCHDPETASARPGVRMLWLPQSRGRAFPRPRASTCAACHVDEHGGAFADRPDGGACDGCHGQERWLPADYGLERHDRESSFRLEGAHRAVPCASCHRPPPGGLVLRPAAEDCAACHAAADPHGEQFAGRACEACHSQESFRIPRFDHGRTRYPLDGAHRDVPCTSCHTTEADADGVARVRWRPLPTRCRDCHGGAS